MQERMSQLQKEKAATVGLIWWWGRKVLSESKRDLFQETSMQDILWIAVTVAFFAIAIAYVHFCERVK
jgi:hypothetical protein